MPINEIDETKHIHLMKSEQNKWLYLNMFIGTVSLCEQMTLVNCNMTKWVERMNKTSGYI